MATSSSGASGANNFKPLPQQSGISLRKRISAEEQDKKLHEVADLYEKQFLGEMLKAMRGTVKESGLVKVGQAEKIYRDELDREYVNNWGKQGGLGLSKIIYDQLIEKYGAKLGIKSPVDKPMGPIQLDEKSNFQVRSKPVEGSASKVGFEFSRDQKLNIGAENAPQITALQAPWSGSLQGLRSIGPDEYLLEMFHDNGLKSQFVFRGQPMPGLLDAPIEAGGTLGLLSPETKNFYWNVMNGSDQSRGPSTLLDGLENEGPKNSVSE